MGISQLFGIRNRIDVSSQNPIYTVKPGSSVKNVFKKQGALTGDAKKELLKKYYEHTRDIDNAQRRSKQFNEPHRPLTQEEIGKLNIVKDRSALSRYKGYVKDGMDEKKAHQLVYGKNGSKFSPTIDELLTKGKNAVTENLGELSGEVKAAINAMPTVLKNARWAAAAGAGVAGVS